MKRNKVLVIAEAGVNHNGDIEIAKKLIEAASIAGADFVKFQTFKANRLVSRTAKKADYQSNSVPSEDDSQLAMLKRLEIPDYWYDELIMHSEANNIKFLSTGFDESSIDYLDETINVPLFKIPSGELTNKPYLKHVASKGKPIILSTGMATLEEVKSALKILFNAGIPKEHITVLHCNTEYPTPVKDVNLLAMKSLAELDLKVGYSDHTLGIEVAIAAVALGAIVIEKHFTIDRNLEGPDHLASLEPTELKQMIDAIRNVEWAIAGTGIKKPSSSELKNVTAARKSIHVVKNLSKGSVLKESDLIMKRPGDGISPMEIDSVIGRKLNRTLDFEAQLKWEYLEKLE